MIEDCRECGRMLTGVHWVCKCANPQPQKIICGEWSLSTSADCPYCEKTLDLEDVEECREEGSIYSLIEGDMRNVSEPQIVNWKIVCPKCEKFFILKGLNNQWYNVEK